MSSADAAGGRPVVPASQLFQGGSFADAEALAAGGSAPGSASATVTAFDGAADDPSSSAVSSSTSSCADVQPSSGGSCADQKAKCSEQWMADGGLCTATCGRC